VLRFLRNQRNGATAKDVARYWLESESEPAEKRARRKLENLIGYRLVHYRQGGPIEGRAAQREPGRYYATPPEGVAEQLGEGL
jgi:hypothetical protein